MFFIPLENEVLKQVMADGKYMGYDVVNNIIDRLKDEELVKKLKENSIKI
jgi:hypothetical protein